MAGHKPWKLSAREREVRIAYAHSVGYDVCKCARAWGLSIAGAHSFAIKNGIHLLNKEGPGRDWQHKKVKKAWPVLQKPEYENQQMFDIQVLRREEWCAKYSVPLWEYEGYLRSYQRKHGKLYPPEVRERWAEEDDRRQFAELHSIAECAAEWGCTQEGARTWCIRHRVHPPRKFPPDVVEQMIGMTVAEAQERFFPASTGIYMYMSKHGLRVKHRRIERK